MRLSKSSRKFWCIFQTRRSFPLIIYLVIYQTLYIWKEIRKKVLLNKIKLYFRCYIQRKRNIFNKKKKKRNYYNWLIQCPDCFLSHLKTKKKKKKKNRAEKEKRNCIHSFTTRTLSRINHPITIRDRDKHKLRLPLISSSPLSKARKYSYPLYDPATHYLFFYFLSNLFEHDNELNITRKKKKKEKKRGGGITSRNDY